MNSPALSAAARLNRSRLRLSLALHQTHAAQSQAKPAHGAAAPPDWLDGLTTDPGLRVLLHTMAAWWAQHPLQDTAAMAALAARELLRPLGQQLPVKLVLGAAAKPPFLTFAGP